MNRRLRRPSQSLKLSAEERYLRYLKPGALAQLRDSKITARSHRCSTDSSHFHHISSLYPSPSQIDGYPCFSARIYSPRCPQRKKLCAPKSVFFNPLSPASDSPDSVIDLFSSDMLVDIDC